MNATPEEINNQAFLKAALEWLRLLLQSRTPPVDERPKHWWSRRRKQSGVSMEKIKAARQAMDDAAQVDPKPAFTIIADKLNLSEFDKDMLLLTAAMEIDPDLPSFIASWHRDPSRRFPDGSAGFINF